MRSLLSRAKFWLTSSVSQKAYWGAMGRLKPVQAVTSECESVTDSLASGKAVVDLLEALGVVSPDAVTLQIGSGLGRVEYHLCKKVRHCYGVDVSPSMVKRAREVVPFDNVEFRCTDGVRLEGWLDETFNLIYSFLVFQHLPRRQFLQYLDDATTKLAPGGHLVFQVMIDETGTRPDPPTNHPYGLRFYRRADVEEALKARGLGEIRRCDLDGRPDDGSLLTGDVVFCAVKSRPQ